MPVVETYGMTEAASMITANPVDGPRKPGSAGRPAGSQVEIALAGGGTAAPGEVGRVRIRGAGVITGYDSGGRPGVIDAAGWLDTSDLGYLDADGYLFLVGRADDVINRGGEKIYPREIEEILLAQPGVRSAAVVGAVDDVLGERPVAYVVTDAAVAAEVEAAAARGLRRAAAPAQAAKRVLPGRGDAARADGEDLPAAAEGPGDFAAVSSTLSDTGPLAPLGEPQPVAAQPVAGTGPDHSRRRAARPPPARPFPAAHHRLRHDPADHHGVRGRRAHAGLGRRAGHPGPRRGEHRLPHQPRAVPAAHGAGADLQLRAPAAAEHAQVLAAAVLAGAPGLRDLVGHLLRGRRKRRAGAFPSAFLHDLLNAGARYHLYFLLVSMQIYLLFPAAALGAAQDRGLPPVAARRRRRLPAVADLALHYHLGRPSSGGLAQFLNAAGQGYWVDTYVLYVVAGAIAGWHFERAVRVHPAASRHRRPRIALVAAVGVIAGLGTYLIEIYGFGATPNNASAVFQPIVILEALTFGWALLGAGLLWSDRGAPHRKFAAAGSASSFGIYLAHPLVLQGLLLVAGASFLGPHGGWLGAIRRAPDGLTVVVLLFVAVPIIYAIAWLIASAARRTPASLMLTGREYTAEEEGFGVKLRGRGTDDGPLPRY